MISTAKLSDPVSIVGQIADIAVLAGNEILRFYHSDYSVRNKSNNSPVTEADIAANDIILSGLADMTPWVPIVSEETAIPDYAERSTWQKYWLIDPLDGTKSFVRGDDQFTVNIALIEGDRPVLGVVHSPVEQSTYWGVDGCGAWRRDADHPYASSISVEAWTRNKDTVAIIAPNTRGHSQVEALMNNLEANGIPCELMHSSSSIKFCRVAEGQADLFPSFSPTCEWDTAAAQCVVECAGGSVTDLSGNRIRYNKADPKLRNPPFIAAGKLQYDWRPCVPLD